MTKLQFAVAAVLAITGCVVLARILFPLPSLEGRSNGTANPAASHGLLADRILEQTEKEDGKSGVHPLPDAAAAFAARVILARSAEHAIDVQYYIWHADLTGLLLLQELRLAADRGVRIRLLLDDNGIEDLDSILSQMNGHPNVEIRLYNPFTTRRFKQSGYIYDFFRLNRRMHNKSFTVDGLVTIGGGRNVGDEYFGTGPQPAFMDLDLLAVGAVVPDASHDFAGYWNSSSAFPLELIIEPKSTSSNLLSAALERVSEGPQRAAYEREIEENETVRQLVGGTLPLDWATATLISDPPSKTLGQARENELLIGQLDGLMGEIEHRLDVVSPYFIPGPRGTEYFVSLVKRGVRVRILTNSLEATDVLPVHAGYAKYRKELLENGVELYELRADAGSSMKRSDTGFAGSSSASLHAKSFAVDGKRIYIGSFNFDPRSARLNTEMGMLVDSDELARELHHRFDSEIDAVSYSVVLREDGSLEWRDESGVSVKTYSEDPNSSASARVAVNVLGWLPIEWLL